MTNLANEFVGAEHYFLRTERAVEKLLDQLYGEWDDFDVDAARMIEVFGVKPNDGAVDVLMRSGFSAVIQHSHPSSVWTKCECCVLEMVSRI